MSIFSSSTLANDFFDVSHNKRGLNNFSSVDELDDSVAVNYVVVDDSITLFGDVIRLLSAFLFFGSSIIDG